MTDSPAARLHLGSLTISLRDDPPGLLAFLAEYYRLLPNDTSGSSRPTGLVLRVTSGFPAAEIDDDRLIVQEVADRPSSVRFRTSRVDAEMDGTAVPPVLSVRILGEADLDEVLRYHIFVVLNRVLLRLGRVQIHAAGVEFSGRALLFAGDKGAGKSTVTLALARAGGTVLAEDHLVLKRGANGLTVSGSDGVLRVTAKTEAAFFPDGLDAPSRLFDATVKKEVRLGAVLRAEPYTDYVPSALIFPYVGRELRMEPSARGAAVTHFLDALRWRHRFESPQAQLDFVDLLVRFVECLPVFTLELSPDLDDLAGLPKLLEQHLAGSRVANV